MLVIISDLHLIDGTCGTTLDAAAFRVFRERLRDMAYEASWRADAQYQPVEKIQLLFLGDIFDVIRSLKWTDPGDPQVRPWDDPTTPQFAQTIVDITQGILDTNSESLKILKSLTDGSTITIPAQMTPKNAELRAAEAARVTPDSARKPVAVESFYVVGNHDWFYHLPENGFAIARNAIVTAMGLANPPNTPFPYEPRELPLLEQACDAHRVFARHGDYYDSLNYEGNRDASSLGDAIVVELLNRFPQEVELRMTNLPPSFAADLQEIDNVRPLLMIPVWIDGLLRRTFPSSKDINQIKGIWDGLVDDFLALPFVGNHDWFLNPFQEVDTLRRLLKFSQGISTHMASHIIRWFTEGGGDVRDDTYRCALKEPAYKNLQARFVVYGHTHRHEIVPLDLSTAADATCRQLYLNAGTWRRVHELARQNPDEQEFIGYNVMSYLAFYKDTERSGRAFESWSGAMDLRS